METANGNGEWKRRVETASGKNEWERRPETATWETKKGALALRGRPFSFVRFDYSSTIADISTGGYPMSCSDSIGMILDGVSGRGG